MRPHIIDKIEKHIADPLDTECKAVYFLVELRKLLDSDKRKQGGYSVLRTMANWACHVDLDTDKGSRDIIQKLEVSIPKFLDRCTEDEGYEELTTVFQEFLFSFETRRQMKKFLSEQKLPTKLCDDTEYWLYFVRSFVGVITDGAMINNTRNSNDKFVEWIIFGSDQPISQNSDGSFPTINVEVTLADARVLKASLRANIDKKQDLVWEMYGPTL